MRKIQKCPSSPISYTTEIQRSGTFGPLEQKRMGYASTVIDQFRYIEIQPKTIDLSTRLWGINMESCGVYSPEPRAEVYCFLGSPN